jgi:hypothetical protein
MASARLVNQTPPPPPEPVVVLELTMEEAQQLRDMVAYVRMGEWDGDTIDWKLFRTLRALPGLERPVTRYTEVRLTPI